MQVLEAKAKALLVESTQMAQLARSKLAEAEELAGGWGVCFACLAFWLAGWLTGSGFF